MNFDPAMLLPVLGGLAALIIAVRALQSERRWDKFMRRVDDEDAQRQARKASRHEGGAGPWG